MALYDWKDDYSVGVTRFDNHHKRLFNIANDLHEMMKQGRGADVIEPVLRELIDYTRYHLAEEEKVMESIGYSNIVSHKMAHKVFTDQLNEAMAEVDQGKTIFVVIKIARTVIDWLINHIYVIDKKYLPEMTAAGIR
ncbi:bacteriohemerythrin [Candidatus Electronema sp. PJ]|uniref:bacteriohemerythrin n=1 Tax=Candidatus Electronema sp. PJ TaxID=3401572 RepID=UPI003AA9CF64